MKKKRLDHLLMEKGLAVSRERAQSAILAGKVLVDDQPICKPGQLICSEANLRVKSSDHPYVSRGGLKLEAALNIFHIEVKDRIALDIGASTGGFTHVLLLRGVGRVHAIDVGYNQLDWKIRKDPRVRVQEKINARYLEFDQIGEQVDLIVIDVSFISLDKILPPLKQFAQVNTDWVTLIKPQFEVGREKIGKGGIVTSGVDRKEAVDRITQFGETLGLKQYGLIESPIVGTAGNQEFLAHWKLH